MPDRKIHHTRKFLNRFRHVGYVDYPRVQDASARRGIVVERKVVIIFWRIFLSVTVGRIDYSDRFDTVTANQRQENAAALK